MVFRWILVQRENPKRWTSDAPASAAAASGAASHSAGPTRVPPPASTSTSAAVRPSAPKSAPAVARTSGAVDRPEAPESAKVAPSASTVLASTSPDANTVRPDIPAMPAPAAGGSKDSVAAAANGSIPDSPPESPEDLQLVIRVQVDPKFSPGVLAHLGKGKVEVHFEVEPDGSVSHATVAESSHARLNGPVLHAVAQWKFEPLHHAQPGAAVLAFDVEQP